MERPVDLQINPTAFVCSLVMPGKAVIIYLGLPWHPDFNENLWEGGVV
jgi:hypothetical protein